MKLIYFILFLATITGCIPEKELIRPQLIGYVYDIDSKAPVPNLKLGTIKSKIGKINYECKTDSNGRFELKKKYKVVFYPPLPRFIKGSIPSAYLNPVLFFVKKKDCKYVAVYKTGGFGFLNSLDSPPDTLFVKNEMLLTKSELH
jgi:hypothetical protein